MAAEKYKQIAETLKTRILSGVYSDRFPPMTLLQREFQVSSRTMTKVCDLLKHEKLIVATPSGSFVGKEYLLPDNARVILLFLHGPHQLPLADDVLFNTFRDAVRQDGFHLRLCDMADPDYEALIAEFAPAGAAFAYSSWNSAIGEVFRKHGIPQVALNWFSDEYDIACVDGDWDCILDQLAGQLVKHHYRRVGLQMNSKRSDYVLCRYRRNLQTWKKLIAKYGLADYGDSWEGMMCDEPPEVVISFGEPVYRELREFYNRRGLPLHIVNLNREIPEEREICWRYTGFDYAVIAREGWKMLRTLIRGGEVADRRMLVKFPSRILFNSTPD